MKKLVLLFILIFSSSFAQDNEELFTSANALYKNGEYKKAIAFYEQLISENLVSSELYYNLGNCYYKLNKVAPSIYNYEKSLQLNPGNEDTRNNLIFAERLTLDRIDKLPETFFQKINNTYLKKISINAWGNISILCTALISLFFLLFYYSYSSVKKRLFFLLAGVSVVVLICALFIGYGQYNIFSNAKQAIVFSEEVSVQNEPTTNGNEAFVLHEGAKVFVLDNVDTWTKIKLTDGKIGWMLTEDLKEL